MIVDDVTTLSREELEAEVLRWRSQQEQELKTAFGRPVRSSPTGHDELFSAVEKTRMPMILTDPNRPDDPIIFVNRAFQELSGYGADELVGRNCRFLQGPGTDQTQVQRIRDALRDKQDIALDILNYRRDGTPFLNELYISPVLGADGRVLYHFGSQVDVTGFRKDKRQLEATERRLRAVFDSAVDLAIITTDRDGLVTDWNTGAEAILGWTTEEMRGKDASRFFTPEDNAAGRVAYEMATATSDGRASDERWHLKKDGSRFWASGEMMPLHNDGGEHLGFLKVLWDRTAQHLAGKALREAEEHRKALLTLSDRLAEHDDVGELTDIACDILGRTLAVQLVGYGTVDPVAETIAVERDWTSGGAKSLAGLLRFRNFGSYIEDIKRGDTVVVTDARTDPRTSEHAAALEERHARAFVNTPVYEYGGLVALLYVSQGEARAWTNDELAFIREVAARTRAATARRQAENALRESESELRQMADALPLLVGIVDRSLTYRFANSGYQPWFGLEPDEVVGRTVADIAGEDGLMVRCPLIEKALGGEQAQADALWPTPDGQRRIADIRYLPRRGTTGAVNGFYAVVQDVTAQRDATALLAEQADRLARKVAERTANLDRVWRLSQELLVVALPDGTLESVNPLWHALLGWTEQELLGTNFIDFTHPDDRDATLKVFATIFEKPLATGYEYRFRHRDGSYRWFAWTAAFEDGRIYASGRDTTFERQQAEQLMQSQKIEAIGQLTGGVAHDFNNLLTIIRSSVDLLRRPNLAEERRHRYLEAVSDTVDRAAKLTGQLLAFARRQALKAEVFDVGARLRGVGDMLDTVTGARIRVVIEVPDQPCFIKADVSQFETALVNMAVNARDAMDGEGRLTLHLACGQTMPSIRGHAPSRKRFSAVSVSDTGSGIAADKLQRIFEPFFTTKGVGKGTGLGLSQVFGFAKQSGGDVDVRSKVGGGTTFTLYLPEEEALAPEATTHTVPTLPTMGDGQRVLVVEDNIEVGRFATQIIEDLGYRPEWACNAEEALTRLGADGSGFDVVFSDVVMPGMGGVGLAEHMRKHLPALPVVLASGYSHVLARESDHGFELLHKPYSAEQLARILQKVMMKAA